MDTSLLCAEIVTIWKNIFVAMKKHSDYKPTQHSKKALKDQIADTIAQLAKTHQPQRLSHLCLLILNHALENKSGRNLCDIGDIERHEQWHEQKLGNLERLLLFLVTGPICLIALEDFGEIMEDGSRNHRVEKLPYDLTLHPFFYDVMFLKHCNYLPASIFSKLGAYKRSRVLLDKTLR